MWQTIAEIAGWWLLSIVKFLLTPSSMIAAGYSYLETVLISSSGAALGAFIFYNGGERIFALFKSKKKKIFTSGNRRLVRIKTRMGIRGLMMVSVFLSVPISSLLAARFFHTERSTLPLMILGFFLWSLLLTGLSWGVRWLVI